MVLSWLRNYAQIINAQKDYLVQLDQAIGDGDHGANMDRGMMYVLSKMTGVEDKDLGTIFKTVGMTLVSTVGGASGPLYGTFFMQMGTTCADKVEMTLEEWSSAVDAAMSGVIARGKAQLGDKTMIDALSPALESLKESIAQSKPLVQALEDAATAAEKGCEATIPLVARKGRASYLGERSAGHQDPGATSMSMLMRAMANAVKG
jgi:dihydroxyacetone kinase-like protein